MWRFVDKLLQFSLLTATASAVFVVVTLIWSSLPGRDSIIETVDPAEAAVEVRLSSHGEVSRLYVGQPLVIDVVLLNLEARRARNQAQVDPEGAVAAAEIELDDGGLRRNLPWERRLTMTMSTPGGATVLNTLDWHTRFLDPGTEAAGRRLGLAPARATLILDGDEMATLLPGPYVIRAALPAEMVAPDQATVIPLEFELAPEPTKDTERAVVSLAVARVAALRGEPARAVEAALTALALDPLQDEALTVAAEAWEQQGDLERAIEWYERYLETLPESASDRRNALADYIAALRQQL